ncbi:hypothetical protein HOY82DRAFT_580398 [Tuber indicum]|nr:hypothetical protein HOY82DRAFT_580398 [Tuber indicum]
MGSISWMVRVFCFFPATSWKVMTLPLLGGRAGCRHLTPLAISRLHGGVLRLSLRSSLHTSGGMQDNMRAVLRPSSSNISTAPPSSLTYNSLIPPSHPHFLHHLLYP